MKPENAGFSLVELVITLVILGIVSAMVAVFMQRPLEGYFDTVRRARIVETADFALRRIARDLAAAVPNTVRSDGTVIELLHARSGGRYCAGSDCSSLLDGSPFEVLGPGVAIVTQGTRPEPDQVVIGNLPGSGCDAYASPSINRRTLNFVASNSTTLHFTGSSFSSDCVELTRRFLIVSGPVAYACDATADTLWRYSNYPIQTTGSYLTPPSSATLNGAGGVKAALATGVDCSGTTFNAAAVGEGIVELRIRVRGAANETVSLYRQVKVDNTP